MWHIFNENVLGLFVVGSVLSGVLTWAAVLYILYRVRRVERDRSGFGPGDW